MLLLNSVLYTELLASINREMLQFYLYVAFYICVCLSPNWLFRV